MATSLLFGAGDLGTQIGFDLARAGDDVVALRRHAHRVSEPLTGVSCDLGAGVDAVRAALEPLTERGGWARGPQRVVVCLTPDARDEEAYRATFVEATGAALAAIAALGWAPERMMVCFQSRFGSEEWLQPYLLTTGWSAGADVLRDPMPLDGLVESSLRALCYLAIGSGVTVARLLRRDA